MQEHFSAPPKTLLSECTTTLPNATEGTTISLICEVEGTYPIAILKWYNGTSSKLLGEGLQEPALVLNITVSRYDNEQPFYCTAEEKVTQLLTRAPNCSVHFYVYCK